MNRVHLRIFIDYFVQVVTAYPILSGNNTILQINLTSSYSRTPTLIALFHTDID